MTKVIIGIVLPFLGTALGSATVFFLKKEMNSKLQNTTDFLRLCGGRYDRRFGMVAADSVN